MEGFRYKLFCTIDMQTHYVEADSLLEAKKKLAKELNVPLSCIDVYGN